MTDNFSDAKDHVCGAPLLSHFSVDLGPDGQRLNVLDLICGDEIRTHRREGVCRFSFGELPATLALKCSFRDVVSDCVTSDMIEHIFF